MYSAEALAAVRAAFPRINEEYDKVQVEQANPPQQIDPAQYDYLAEDEAVTRAMA